MRMKSADESARHDPWGNIEEEFNPRGIEQDIRLSGQHYDKETGLYYNRYRYYDPKIGSYTNQDSIGLAGGANHYNYPVNPTRRIDPLGLWSTEVHNYFIDTFAVGKSFSPEAIAAIKAGSRDADILFVDDNYMHAMQNSKGDSVAHAKAEACASFKKYMNEYRSYLEADSKYKFMGSTLKDKAYNSLGRALHIVMDSTSPVHEWGPMEIKNLKYHGSGGRTLENEPVARKPAYKESTVDAMNKAMLGCPDFCK
jgi:RHS repeat-associated protein